MRACRVVIVCHTAQLGGAETALLRLLGAVDREKFDVRAVLFDDGELPERLVEGGIPVDIVRLGKLNAVNRHQSASPVALLRNAAGTARFVPALVIALRRHRADLLVATSLKAASALSVVAPLAATPWVWHLHDRLAADYLPRATASVLRVIGATLPRHVIVNSWATLQTLGRRGRSRASVAYPGLDPSAFAAASGCTDGGAIGILGRISETKGQLEFVQAAAALLETHPDARFQIIGAALFQDGEYERQVRAAVAAAGLEDRIGFAGWAADSGAVIRRLRLLVHASPVPEPFGQVVVEAMAAGTPVIATDAGGVPEVLDPDGRAENVGDGVRRTALGLLVRPGDPRALATAMAWTLDNPEAAGIMAAAARSSAVDRFSIHQTSRIVEAVWRRCARPANPVVRG